MKINIQNLSFAYSSSVIFDGLNADLDGGETGRPLVILGLSGCGKTTLLKLIGSLLKPQNGQISVVHESTTEKASDLKSAFMFQESRLLPWLNVIDNVALPLEKDFGKQEAKTRARHFLSLVSLEEKENAYPAELSGGQVQRVSMARAFAWPAPLLLMDEPFQSLDIPLRINLMDTCLLLNERENFSGRKRLLVAVTHDPREALYMGGRIIILGEAGKGIIFDKKISISPQDRVYGSAVTAEMEREMIAYLESSAGMNKGVLSD